MKIPKTKEEYDKEWSRFMIEMNKIKTNVAREQGLRELLERI